jgi:DNA phosphorothioation-associated putative methyltransferase
VNVQIIGQKFSNGRPLAGIVHGGGIAGLEKQSIGFRTGLAVSAEERLHVPLEPEPLLRIYEGCGRTYLGDVEGANIIKIHRRSGKLSYLVYPEFENDPHPALLRCVRLNLRTRQIECYDYASNANPPVLHRKETFLTSDDLRRDKFARLTTQEEKQGLLEDSSSIGTRNGWQRRLNERGFALKGHRLVRSNGNPSSATEPKWE